jgi:Ser/Thr protein kinase RdoA (MazF antagonist)
MNSLAWTVITGETRYVAKLVPHSERSSFEAGLAAAEHLQAQGFDSGCPIRSIGGQLTVDIGDRSLALLRFVPGRALAPDDGIDQQWWGDRLGAVHLALAGFTHPGLTAWHWIRPDAAHLGLQDWIRPSVLDAVKALEKLQVTDRLTFGALHGDPYHGAFLLDRETGRIGVIDWGAVVFGPLVYDLASAVMYAGGIESAEGLLDAYASTGAVPPAEIDSALPILLRFRWAVQADYFAARVVSDPSEENLAGLDNARAALSSGGEPASRG